MDIENLLSQIDQVLAEIKTKRPLSEGELAELRKTLNTEFTYHSNAIEGNSLTLGETKLILEDGLTIAGKPLREIYEASNHKALFERLYRAIEDKTIIDEGFIKDIHRLVLRNIDDENAGVYRKIQVRISGDEAMPPAPSEIELLMAEFVRVFHKANTTDHPVTTAAKFHYRFVKIHPFIDGNGRTVRILMNLLLMSSGCPMTIIPLVRRAEYIQSLHSAKTEADFVCFFADIVLQNCKDYLRMIQG